MNGLTPAGLARRLAAIVYDAIVLTAILFAATVPLVLISGGAVEQVWLLQLYLLGVGFAFFGGFWHFGGQTIGMRAWRVRVVRSDGTRASWRDVAVRYGVALLAWGVVALGFLWSLIDVERRTWHDLASGTRLVRTDQ
jgi:uncharacterized RDD family membrane protein YckC